jgi:ABC-type hemin transport system ATPase subunit/GNAT superfamily N-acetyltransferase
MPTITVHLETPLARTFRVEQVAGLFDVPLAERLRQTLTAEVPGLEEAWTIGAIVGPSGSGKTTLARAAYGDAVYEPQPWPAGRAMVEVLGEMPKAATSGRGVLSGGVATASRQSRSSRNGGLDRDPWSRHWTIKEIARVLCAVGLGSVPAWLKPYEVLSTGERFRADLARAVIQESGVGGQESGSRRHLLVFDEFTSTLDRTVAKTASAALARFLRSEAMDQRREGETRGVGDKETDEASQLTNGASLSLSPGLLVSPSVRFVALTCHTDILPWLAPDWTLYLRGSLAGASGWREQALTRPSATLSQRERDAGQPRLVWGRQPRPGIKLRVERVPQALWARFAPHHYLSGGLAASATCYAAWWEEPVAFCAVVAALGWKKTKRIARLVTLPEFQGLGIGTRLMEAVAKIEAARGNRVTITASHPAIVSHCSHSPGWRLVGVKKTGSTRQRMAGREIRCSAGRAVAGFEFVPGEREA